MRHKHQNNLIFSFIFELSVRDGICGFKYLYLEETIFKKVRKKIIFLKEEGISLKKMSNPNTIHLLSVQSLIEYKPSFGCAVPN